MEQDIKEKKVEYLELIYDLIFVFSFRRNMTLMRIITDGFVTKAEFLAYFLCTMAVIQIWNFSTHYINLYGKNSLRNHVYLFVNMFLLYFMGVGEKARGQEFQIRHHIAWGLIILNTAIQYALELRNYRNDPQHQSYIKRMTAVLGIQAVLIFATFRTEGVPAMLVSCLIILCGVIAGLAVGKGSGIRVDFMHLTERVMLLVVLTFGEMIIALTDYFDESISPNNIYFALMAFLIVIGLFLTYGLHYDSIFDRERKTNGLEYMFIHMLFIFALNCVTCSLEFMHEEEVRLIPKMVFLICSLLCCHGFLFLMEKYAETPYRKIMAVRFPAAAVIFTVLMFLLKDHMHLNIAVTVLYVFAIWFILYRNVNKENQERH